MMEKQSGRGFTLIELLVVIAIIAILAAILFPVFARARENARKTNCASNVKQILLGIHQYAQDYDEVLPYASQWGSPLQPWHYYLQPYLKNSGILKCPSYPGAAQGYGWNYQNFGYYSSGTGAFSNNPGRALAAVPVPAETILIADNPDAGMYGAGGIFAYGPTQMNPSGAAANPGNAPARHSDGGNYGFVDGHVKWLAAQAAASQDRLWTVAED